MSEKPTGVEGLPLFEFGKKQQAEVWTPEMIANQQREKEQLFESLKRKQQEILKEDRQHLEEEESGEGKISRGK